MAFVEPEGHAYPAEQFPVHALLVSPLVAPYRPAGQGVQVAEPGVEKVPGLHMVAVEEVDPAGHM